MYLCNNYDFKNPVVLEYNDENDTLCFSFSWNKIGINAVGDTGERFKPVESPTAASTPSPGTNATSKPSKTRCPNCKGTGSCPKCRGSMWVTEWKYVYVKGSPELTQSTHLCDEKYCYGGSCYMCGGDGWVDD